MASKFEDGEFTVAITEWLCSEVRRDYPRLRPAQLLLGRIGVDTRALGACQHPPAIRRSD